MNRYERIVIIGLLMLTIITSIACAPSFWDDASSQPVIKRAWQCPTPSPNPTVVVGYQPTFTPNDPSATIDPNITPESIYSTPMPTATPYVRAGSDYYQGQRIDIGGKYILSVTGYSRQPSTTAGQEYHKITIQLEASEPAAILFDFSSLRSIRGTDGRMIIGEWIHNAKTAESIGINPISDPELDIDDQGDIIGGYPEGTSTRTLVYVAPAGEAQQWGMSFNDTGTTNRDGGVGDSQVWVILKSDPNCTDAGGSVSDSSGGNIPPPGTPVAGSGRYPVPLDTPISRGFGCHHHFTGTRGNCGGATPWWHDGIDFAKPEGTPLFATRNMTVDFAGVDSSTIDCSGVGGSKPPHFGFGQYVRTHDDLGYTYWYGHVLRWRVSAGQKLSAGSQIGDMGSTGCSTGPHLHFRVRKNGLDINPFDVISK